MGQEAIGSRRGCNVEITKPYLPHAACERLRIDIDHLTGALLQVI